MLNGNSERLQQQESGEHRHLVRLQPAIHPQHALYWKAGEATNMELHAKTYRCPDMVSQSDADMVQESLLTVPGIDRVEPNYHDHTVFVTCAVADDFRFVVDQLRSAGYPPEE
jgi:hypothetical protein